MTAAFRFGARFAVGGTLLLLLLASPAHAVIRNWSGAPLGFGDWTDANSWSNGVPANNITADVASFFGFTGGPVNQPFIDLARSVNGVQIVTPINGATAPTFEFDGSALTLGVGGIDVDALGGSGHTFQNNLALGSADQTWTIATSLIVNGNISAAAGGPATKSLQKGGVGSLSLNGFGSWTGTTTLRQGSIVVSGGDALPDGTSFNFFQDGSVARVLNLDEDETIGGLSSAVGVTQVTVQLDDQTLTINGPGEFASGVITGSASGGLAKSGSGLFTVRTQNTYAGQTTVSGGELAALATSGLALGDGNKLVENTGRLSGRGELGGIVSLADSGTLAGDFTMDELAMSGGIVELEWMSEDLIIRGDATIGTGTIRIVSDTPLDPAFNTTWTFLRATGGRNGQFAFSDLPDLPSGKGWELLYTTTTAQIRVVSSRYPGDYNGDNTVNAADYVVWRNSLGQMGDNLPADGTGVFGVPDGKVDIRDYNFWKQHFGESGGSGSGLGNNGGVPEPAAALLMAIAFLCTWISPRWRFRPRRR